jgi:hypothetical protein
MAYTILAHLRSSRRNVAAAILLSAVPLVLVYFVHSYFGVEFREFTQDPADRLGGHPYVGIISMVGVMMWSGAAAACVVTVLVCHRLRAYGSNQRLILFLFFSSAWLAADDVMQLHEAVFPWAGIPEVVSELTYVVLFSVFLYILRDMIISTRWVLLMASIVALGASLLADMLLPHSDLQTFMEDGAKFVGIVFWTVFVVETNAEYLSEALRKRGSPLSSA